VARADVRALDVDAMTEVEELIAQLRRAIGAAAAVGTCAAVDVPRAIEIAGGELRVTLAQLAAARAHVPPATPEQARELVRLTLELDAAVKQLPAHARAALEAAIKFRAN
jgi:hypothetical protein